MPESTATSIDSFVYEKIKLMKNKGVCIFHPNVYTIIGLLCIPLIVHNIYFHKPMAFAILIIFIKSVLDVLDGSVARKCGLTSELGHILDHLSDLIFYGSIGVLLLFKSISNNKHYHSLVFFFFLFHLYKYVVGLDNPSNFGNFIFKIISFEKLY